MASTEYVAYHSVEVMGRDYKTTGKSFSFWSGKTKTYLEKSIGSNVWVITGKRDGKKVMIYRLAAVYTPDAVSEDGDGYLITGSHGHVFTRPLELNALPWFVVLLKEQNRFSFGFSRIQSAEVIAELNALLEADQKRKSIPL